MKALLRILPWALLGLFLTEIVAVLVPRQEKGFHLREFGRLPVLLNGRVQPFDSLGRNALLQMRSTAAVPLEEVPSWQFWHHARKLTPAAWLIEVVTVPDSADQRPVFLIHHPELLRTLRLDQEGINRSGLRYYTYNQVRPHLAEIEDLGSQFETIEDKLRSPYQRQLLKLRNAVVLYQRLQLSLQPPGTVDLAELLAEFERAAPAGARALRARQAGQAYDAGALSRFMGPANGFLEVANKALPLVVPPRDPHALEDGWVNFGRGVLDSLKIGEMHPTVVYLAAIASAYRRGNEADFNLAVDEYRQWLEKRFPGEAAKGRAESYYNEVQAFLHAMIIYLTAFLLAAGALLCLAIVPNVAESLRRASVMLIILAFAVHSFGLVFRMVLEGRPPVTNLYSSAIFIGWGAVVLGLLLERLFKMGLGSAVAAFSGFVTLIIAHNLALGGDTMEMLQAVLDTNFWLSTHVTTVTLGYASTFVAGLLGMAYLFLGMFTPLLSRKLEAHRVIGPVQTPVPGRRSADLGKALGKMIYGVVCFATLFSFTGTVLGGIWADQSWGRFWGWDPKENGALIIVLWNALILHARWGGFVGGRGMAMMGIFGNIVTSFSWFGVNMLGVGLHSYGFMDAAFKYLLMFVGSQIFFILLGTLPLRMWRSFRPAASVQPVQPGRTTSEKTAPARAGA